MNEEAVATRDRERRRLLPQTLGLSLVVRPALHAVALATLVLSFFLPPGGLGIWPCSFRELTQRPCFGCGLTRGVTAISDADFDRAWSMHPFAFLYWVLAAILAAGVVPAIGRAQRRFAERHDRILTRAALAIFAAFLVFGTLRLTLGAAFFPQPL